MIWPTDFLNCQLSMSRVNGDVRGDSPTTHVDLLDQILGERLISPVATVRADPGDRWHSCTDGPHESPVQLGRQ